MKVFFDDARREPRRNRHATVSRELVLLVEDDSGVCSVISRFLEADGYEVIVAEGPQEALAMLENSRWRVDLLLTDVVMPGMNGFHLAEQVREQHPDVKVLYTTGYLDDTIARCGVDEKQYSLLRKPFSRGALSAKIREAMAP